MLTLKYFVAELNFVINYSKCILNNYIFKIEIAEEVIFEVLTIS